ncbi:MAG: hypothetical protein Phyf2KO_07520 [Phycisphaerales bacterium]
MMKSALLGGTLAAITCPALSQLTEDSVIRYNTSSVIGGTDSDGPNTTFGPTSGEWTHEEFTSAVDGGNGGSASGYQVSDIANGAYSGYVDAACDAFGDGNELANSMAMSHLEVDFSLAVEGEYTLSGFVNAFGEINGENSIADIQLIDLSDNSLIWGLNVTDDFIAFDEAGTLAAGSYRIVSESLAIVNRDFTNSFGSSTATVDFEMTVTPSPQTLTTLLVGVGCMSRRRRRLA